MKTNKELSLLKLMETRMEMEDSLYIDIPLRKYTDIGINRGLKSPLFIPSPVSVAVCLKNRAPFFHLEKFKNLEVEL